MIDMGDHFCCECGKRIDNEEKCGCIGNLIQYCPYCGTKYNDDDFLIENEKEEYWGAPVFRMVIVGVICHECGEKLDL